MEMRSSLSSVEEKVLNSETAVARNQNMNLAAN